MKFGIEVSGHDCHGKLLVCWRVLLIFYDNVSYSRVMKKQFHWLITRFAQAVFIGPCFDAGIPVMAGGVGRAENTAIPLVSIAAFTQFVVICLSKSNLNTDT